MTDLSKPKWELYDIDGNFEADYFESQVVEYCDIAGTKIDYYIRNTNEEEDFDTLYGETTDFEYLGPYSTKAVYQPTEEPTIISTFGLTSDEVISYMYIPKLTFTRDVSAGYEPKPGDAIKVSWNDRNYEVVDVGEEENIFQLHKKVWEFILRPYRFSEQSDSAKDILEEPWNTETAPITAMGDNEWLEDESDNIEDYSDESTEKFFGY